MGIWTVTERVSAELQANLGAAIAEVAAAHGKVLVTEFAFFKRERADTFAAKISQAGLGVWVRSARAGAARTQKRDWIVSTMIDYAFRGGDRTAVAEQVELTTQAILRVIDGLAGSDMTLGAGEGEFAIAVIHDITERIQEAAGRVSPITPVIAAARIEVAVLQRELV